MMQRRGDPLRQLDVRISTTLEKSSQLNGGMGIETFRNATVSIGIRHATAFPFGIASIHEDESMASSGISALQSHSHTASQG